MTSEFAIRFFFDQPFMPFEMYLVDGRVLRVPHPEFASMERFAVAITIFEETGHTEVVDMALIVSFRTLWPI